MVVECGYAESYDKLKQDVATLLEGSEGRIGKAILVKLESITATGTMENGFVEVWGYDYGLGVARRRGGRFVRFSMAAPLSLLRFVQKIYPAPLSRHTQAVRFTAGELLRDRYDDEKTPTSKLGIKSFLRSALNHYAI